MENLELCFQLLLSSIEFTQCVNRFNRVKSQDPLHLWLSSCWPLSNCEVHSVFYWTVSHPLLYFVFYEKEHLRMNSTTSLYSSLLLTGRSGQHHPLPFLSWGDCGNADPRSFCLFSGTLKQFYKLFFCPEFGQGFHNPINNSICCLEINIRVL